MLLPKGFDVGAGVIPALTPQFICNGCLRRGGGYPCPNPAKDIKTDGTGME